MRTEAKPAISTHLKCPETFSFGVLFERCVVSIQKYVGLLPLTSFFSNIFSKTKRLCQVEHRTQTQDGWIFVFLFGVSALAKSET
jgi:hypothetical protein